MKRLVISLLAALLLAGCGAKPDTEVVWQAELDGGGALTLVNCTVTESETGYWADPNGAGEVTEMLPLLYAEGTPLFTVPAQAREAFAIYFAVPMEGGYHAYAEKLPQIKVDYVVSDSDDGALLCRIDTIYSFMLEVGEQRWLVQCDRDV